MSRPSPALRRVALVAALLGVALLTACAPDGSTEGSSSPAPSESISAAPSPSGTPTDSPSPSPSATAEAAPLVPTDCRAILSESVLSQLGATPLNDPALSFSTGIQPDGSLVCIWRDARADTTGLWTTISHMSSGPALDMLNGLVATDGFTCFTPDNGTRCEKTWTDGPYGEYGVIDGRTLFYRSGVLIDTSFSNLAPLGYTDAIVAHLFG